VPGAAIKWLHHVTNVSLFAQGNYTLNLCGAWLPSIRPTLVFEWVVALLYLDFFMVIPRFVKFMSNIFFVIIRQVSDWIHWVVVLLCFACFFHGGSTRLVKWVTALLFLFFVVIPQVTVEISCSFVLKHLFSSWQLLRFSKTKIGCSCDMFFFLIMSSRLAAFLLLIIASLQLDVIFAAKLYWLMDLYITNRDAPETLILETRPRPPSSDTRLLSLKTETRDRLPGTND